MAKALSNLMIVPIVAPNVAVVVLIIVAQVMSCGGLIREANALAIFAGALLSLHHLLACLLGACFVSQPEDFEKAYSYPQLARDALVGAWIAFVTALMVLVVTLPPHSRFTCCGDGRLVFAGLYTVMHGIFLVQYYISSTATCEEMVEWMV